jgi:hypothetical protein
MLTQGRRIDPRKAKKRGLQKRSARDGSEVCRNAPPTGGGGSFRESAAQRDRRTCPESDRIRRRAIRGAGAASKRTVAPGWHHGVETFRNGRRRCALWRERAPARIQRGRPAGFSASEFCPNAMRICLSFSCCLPAHSKARNVRKRLRRGRAAKKALRKFSAIPVCSNQCTGHEGFSRQF